MRELCLTTIIAWICVLRRDALDRGAIWHREWQCISSRPTTDRSFRRLASALWEAITKAFPSRTGKPAWYLSGVATSKCIVDSDIEVELGKVLHTTLKKDHKLRVTVRRTILQGKLVATLPPTHHALAALHSSIKNTDIQQRGGTNTGRAISVWMRGCAC